MDPDFDQREVAVITALPTVTGDVLNDVLLVFEVT